MSPDQEAIRDVVAAFEDSWSRHDMETFAELFTEDADFVNVVGLWWKGRPEIKQAHENSHATMFKNSNLSIPETSIRFLRPNVAVGRSVWELVGHTSPQGETLSPQNGILTNVVTEEGGRWAIVASQNTDIMPLG